MQSSYAPKPDIRMSGGTGSPSVSSSSSSSSSSQTYTDNLSSVHSEAAYKEGMENKET